MLAPTAALTPYQMNPTREPTKSISVIPLVPCEISNSIRVMIVAEAEKPITNPDTASTLNVHLYLLNRMRETGKPINKAIVYVYILTIHRSIKNHSCGYFGATINSTVTNGAVNIATINRVIESNLVLPSFINGYNG